MWTVYDAMKYINASSFDDKQKNDECPLVVEPKLGLSVIVLGQPASPCSVTSVAHFCYLM